MKEFMVFIKKDDNPIVNLSPKQQQEHIQKVGSYIRGLFEAGKLKAAQPLETEGAIVTQEKGKIMDGPFNETKEVISGYYQLLAADLNEATQIIKADPRFEDGDWKLEIRPVMKVDGIN